MVPLPVCEEAPGLQGLGYGGVAGVPPDEGEAGQEESGVAGVAALPGGEAGIDNERSESSR